MFAIKNAIRKWFLPIDSENFQQVCYLIKFNHQNIPLNATDNPIFINSNLVT